MRISDWSSDVCSSDLCTASDGDTIRCGSERIRLLGIDAPEMPGHCRKGRQCAPGNPRAAKAGLARAISPAPIRIDWITVARYGPPIAGVYARKANGPVFLLPSVQVR